ncbi:hypothetical protein [Amycolatopsis sp. NPDC049159]|uniref:hypothetical protein n=1 Tax=Amycolatopsis sp. NPDC049159 TaxID=3157210 RepID=UPI003404A47E
MEIRHVNATIPTGNHGKDQKKPGSLHITPGVVEFRYRILFDMKTYRILRAGDRLRRRRQARNGHGVAAGIHFRWKELDLQDEPHQS